MAVPGTGSTPSRAANPSTNRAPYVDGSKLEDVTNMGTFGMAPGSNVCKLSALKMALLRSFASARLRLVLPSLFLKLNA